MRSVPLAVLLYLMLPLLCVSASSEPASLVDVQVVRDKGFVRIEIILSQPVRPVVTTAKGPERLVVVLPGTVSEARQRRIVVGASGVKAVRVGLHSAAPPETDLVVDLEPTRSYSHAVDMQGNKIVLAVTAEPRNSARRPAPAEGSVSPLIGIFRKRTPPPAMPAGRSAPGDAATRASSTAPAISTPAASAAPQSAPVTSSAPAPSAPPAQGSGSAASFDGVAAASQLAPGARPPAAPSASSPPRQTLAAEQPSPLRAANRETVESANAVPPALTMRVPNSDLRIAFTVKYVTQGAAYLDGGRSSGLAEGMKLEIMDSVKAAPPGAAPTESSATAGSETDAGKKVVAELEVVAVAETSAVTEIKTSTRDVKKGDWAYLSAFDQATLVEQRTLSSTRKYPEVIAFTEGDPLEEEARAEVPRPPSPEINRARGRIGFDYGGIHSGSGLNSHQVGMVMRIDLTRIAGTYWNLSGFWRGRLQTQSSNVQPTIQDLIDRTYTLSMTYDNPNSKWVMGFGRLYLPWAPSLDTIDGGYFGRKLAQGVTAGIFGGSTPDPASWSYTPGRRLGGTFINFQGGSFEDLRYSATMGGAVSTIYGQFDRPLAFFEGGLYYKRVLSIYDSAQVDDPPPNPAVASPGWGLARNFLTFRIQPIARLSFDLNHSYFRDVPTFDPALIGTGLLDKYLFQGVSAGVRAEVVRHVTLYTTLGRSTRTGDARSSLNQLYGLTVDRIWRTKIRADVHYSRFNSSFGSGTYEALSLSRNFGDRFHFELLGGQQDFNDLNSSASRSRFITSMFDVSIAAHYFLGGGFTAQRGGMMNYDQWYTMMGYRFDNRGKHRNQ